MRITIERTAEAAVIDGKKTRVWRGKAKSGTECLFFVARVGVPVGANCLDLSELQNAGELYAMRANG